MAQDNEYLLWPIGYIRSDLLALEEAPRQGSEGGRLARSHAEFRARTCSHGTGQFDHRRDLATSCGSRMLSKRLRECGIAYRYEEFDDNHSGIDYRMEFSLPFLYRALKALTVNFTPPR